MSVMMSGKDSSLSLFRLYSFSAVPSLLTDQIFRLVERSAGCREAAINSRQPS